MASYAECLQIIRDVAEPFIDEGVSVDEDAVLGAELGPVSCKHLRAPET